MPSSTWLCCNLLGEDDTAWENGTSTLKRSLANDGVETFKSGLLSISEPDIDQLTDADSGAPLPILWRRKPKIVLAYYHTTSREKAKLSSIHSITPDLFNLFCISDYNPNEPILPWNSKNTPILKTRDDEVIQWPLSRREPHKSIRRDVLSTTSVECTQFHYPWGVVRISSLVRLDISFRNNVRSS